MWKQLYDMSWAGSSITIFRRFQYCTLSTSFSNDISNLKNFFNHEAATSLMMTSDVFKTSFRMNWAGSSIIIFKGFKNAFVISSVDSSRMTFQGFETSLRMMKFQGFVVSSADSWHLKGLKLVSVWVEQVFQ